MPPKEKERLAEPTKRVAALALGLRVLNKSRNGKSGGLEQGSFWQVSGSSRRCGGTDSKCERFGLEADRKGNLV